MLPPEGGDTQFADMRAAYDMLDAKIKAQIEELVCEHSRIFSKGALGIPFTEKELRDFAPVRQRSGAHAIRVTGRKSLYLSSPMRDGSLGLAGAGSADPVARSDRARDAT